MTSKSLNRQILNLAIPNILNNLSVPLLSAVDTALVGHLPSAIYIGAVAIGSMIFNFIYWGFGFLRMGTTGLTAQAFGKQDQQQMQLYLWRSLSFALIAGLLLILLQDVIAFIAFKLIEGSPTVEKFAHIYFRIRIYAAPATLGLYAIHGWLLGMQNARLPLLITVSINVLNIIFNVLFILHFKMNSDGVALGTVVAQYLGVLFSIYFLMKFYRIYLKIPDFKEILKLSEISHFFKLNLDIFIRTMSLLFAFSFFTAQSAKLGDVTLAANSVLIQLWMFFSYGIDGFAFAGESLVGNYLGAGKKAFLIKIVRKIFIFGSGLGLLFSFIYALFGEPIGQIFTNNIQVLKMFKIFLPWTIVAPFLNSFCYIWDGIYLGATASKGLRNAMLLVTFGIYLPLHYLLTPLFANHGMWAALLTFMIFRSISLSYLSKKHLDLPVQAIIKGSLP